MKYDLAKMLEEARRDDRGGKGADKKVLTQEQIKAMARGRRKPAAGAKPPAK